MIDWVWLSYHQAILGQAEYLKINLSLKSITQLKGTMCDNVIKTT